MPGIDKYRRKTGSCQNKKKKNKPQKSENFGIGTQLVKICQVPLPSVEPVNPLMWLGKIYPNISQIYLEWLGEVSKCFHILFCYNFLFTNLAESLLHGLQGRLSIP